MQPIEHFSQKTSRIPYEHIVRPQKTYAKIMAMHSISYIPIFVSETHSLDSFQRICEYNPDYAKANPCRLLNGNNYIALARIFQTVLFRLLFD